MPAMRKRRLLLAAVALSTVLGACEKKRRPIIYANQKSPMYPPDAGVDPAAPDAPAEVTSPAEPSKP
jgi:hypothetical protein